MTAPSTRGWHVARWPPLAWVETAVKGAAQVIGIAILIRALGDDVHRPSGLRLAELVVLMLMSLGLVGAIADRIAEREIVAMAFVIPNNVAHWGVAFALTTIPGPGHMAGVFFASMAVGEFVKLAFLRTSGYRVRTVAPAVVSGLTAGYGVGYLILLVLNLLA